MNFIQLNFNFPWVSKRRRVENNVQSRAPDAGETTSVGDNYLDTRLALVSLDIPVDYLLLAGGMSGISQNVGALLQTGDVFINRGLAWKYLESLFCVPESVKVQTLLEILAEFNVM